MYCEGCFAKSWWWVHTLHTLYFAWTHTLTFLCWLTLSTVRSSTPPKVIAVNASEIIHEVTRNSLYQRALGGNVLSDLHSKNSCISSAQLVLFSGQRGMTEMDPPSLSHQPLKFCSQMHVRQVLQLIPISDLSVEGVSGPLFHLLCILS